MKYSQNQLNQFKSFWNDVSSSGLQLETDHSDDRIPYNKKGNKICIKKENKGKFTEYCGGNVTDACIQKGKNSSDPKIRNHVQKHQLGGITKLIKAAGVARALNRSLKEVIKNPYSALNNTRAIKAAINVPKGYATRTFDIGRKGEIKPGMTTVKNGMIVSKRKPHFDNQDVLWWDLGGHNNGDVVQITKNDSRLKTLNEAREDGFKLNFGAFSPTYRVSAPVKNSSVITYTYDPVYGSVPTIPGKITTNKMSIDELLQMI